MSTTIQIVRATPPKWNADGTAFGNENAMFKITTVPDEMLYEDSDGELIRTGGGGITCIIEGLAHHKGFAYNTHKHTTLVCNREEAVALIKDYHIGS